MCEFRMWRQLGEDRYTEGAAFMLARQQLHDLQRLLEEADAEIQTMHLLSLFQAR